MRKIYEMKGNLCGCVCVWLCLGGEDEKQLD